MLSFFLTCLVIVLGLGACYVLLLLGMLALAGIYHAVHEGCCSLGRGAMVPLVLLRRHTTLPVEYVIPAVLGTAPFVLLACALLR